MTRVKRAKITKKKHKKLRKMTKGFKAAGRHTIKMARQRILKAGDHAYVDRRKKKINFRRLWIVRINAALRESGTTYSKFINNLRTKNIELDRKILAQLAFEHPAAFKLIVKEVMS